MECSIPSGFYLSLFSELEKISGSTGI